MDRLNGRAGVMDKAGTPVHTDHKVSSYFRCALSPSQGDAAMIRRTLIVAILAVAGLVPFFTAPAANAMPYCNHGFSCLYLYYSSPARTTEVGYYSVSCSGYGSIGGTTSPYVTFSETECNN
jgi:hypothetical protein